MDLRAERMQALVLRTTPYGEADVVVHLLVRGRGRLPAFARGARASRKRFGGALEPFQLVEALLVEGKELWALREARVVEGFAGLRDDLHRLAHAGYATELVHDLTRAGEPADGLFSLLHDFLFRLQRAPATSARLRALELGALGEAGLSPQLDRCARCGDELRPGRVALSPGAGGLTCAPCTEPGSLWLTLGARAALLQLRAGGFAAADAPVSADGSGRPADARGFEQACAEAGRPLGAFVEHHLGRRLNSTKFLAEVGAPQ